MLQGSRNKFTLTYGDVSTDFCPKNWEDLDVLISRDRMAVDQEVTAEFEMYGAAATVVSTAYNAGQNVTLTIQTLQNDWTYGNAWTFTSDMETYAVNGRVISLGFIENTCRDEIEKNKGTKYDIDIPEGLTLSYTGVNRDKTNTIQSLVIPAGGANQPCEILGGGAIYIAAGVKTQSEPSDNWIFTDYDGFYARALKNTTATIRFTLNKRRYLLYQRYDDVRLMLVHARIIPGAFKIINNLATFAWNERTDTSFYTFTHGSELTFTNNGARWFQGVGGFPGLSVDIGAGVIQAGDIIALIIVAPVPYVSQSYVDGERTVMSVVSSDVSRFTSYPVQVVSIEWTIEQLLAKMCAVPPALTYNLPKYNEAGYYVPVFTSGSALQHTDSPKMSISFEDVMKFLRCMYCADYDIMTGSLVIDTAEAFYGGDSTETVVPISGVERKRDTEHVFNSVEAGWETDDNVENGQFEILCKNTFKINSKVKDKKLDLVSPFKGSPYLIEQYLDEKATQSSKTKEQDNDVFVFCVVPFTSGTTTTLYRYPSGTSATYDTYFNLPMSPMRFIIANSKYIGVSLFGLTKELEYVSTDRFSNISTRIEGESVAVAENVGDSAVLVAGLSTPYFLPETIEFETTGLMTRAEILALRHKYFTIEDKFNGGYNYYINDISLPLTKNKSYKVIGLRRL